MTRFFQTFVALALVLGTTSFSHGDDGSSISADDRKLLISQLVDQLKNGSDLTDPGARIAAMSGAADYFEKIGDKDAADAQIKNAAFHLLNSNHLEFVSERNEAAQLMSQVELLSVHDDSPETKNYVTKWKREVASRALNENQVVDSDSMGNWNSLVSTLASNKEFDDLFQATLKNSARSGNVTLDQAVALEAYIQTKDRQEYQKKAERALVDPGCPDQIEESEPKLDPELLKSYAAAAMQLIDPNQENLNSILPIVWSLRNLVGPDDKEAYDKKVAAFWKAYQEKYPQQSQGPSEEEREKMYQEQVERTNRDMKMVNSYTREMSACMKTAPAESQGGCWAVFADSVALLSDPAEQMVHSGGALVMRDNPQDRARGATVLENAIDTENKNRKDSASKIGDYYGMMFGSLSQNEMSFAEPLGILARHEPQLALQLANQLDDEKARVAAKNSILMHMTETDGEKKEMTAREADTYSNQENEFMEQMDEMFSRPEQQDQGNQVPTAQGSSAL